MKRWKRISKPKKMVLHRLAALASVFTNRTHIIETMLDPTRGEWLLGFDNGYALTLRANGRWRAGRQNWSVQE